MQLTWLGAAGFKIDTNEGAVILIDPFLSRPAGATPRSSIHLTDLSPVDEILLTHGRFEHTMDTPALVAQTGAIVHAPGSVCGRLTEAGVPANNLECITLQRIKRVGTLGWQAWPGRMSQADSWPSLPAFKGDQAVLAQINHLERQWPAGETVIYFFQVNHLSLIHFGSAGWVEAAIKDLRPDIALLPVEGIPDKKSDVVRLISLLKPRVVIPHHWDNYYPPLTKTVDLGQLETILRTLLAPIKVYQPTLGRRFSLARLLSNYER
ncbi:MAG: MBL fold metallo-hydrolase [Anaerolineae bacterium]|nr:MBL fold metallo-hydrolase [Anaerolineae bacterium]